ncbi:hypothetical protein [Paraburkholderia phenazinium]|jgi:hypothetical protein|uniref:Uncharacterized protein n=1 Tax=Paraburkholderia phenazinium TaxID=60549 RepID=A0A1G8IE61_9BURK|nr:hypothetical protein [Paraburkholderia phenazinium]SDI17196.1 hypothetical protein SAMN05216466_11867 [Paraburkholderia phenazinium]
MKMTIPLGLTLLAVTSAASAWQPVVYPVRSQSAWQQSADAAACYGVASQQTKVNITQQAQSPMPPKFASGVTLIGGAQVSQPPLPASGAASASATMTGAAPAGAMPTSAAAAAAMAQASEPMPKTDKNGIPELGGASEPQTAAEVKPPPMPPPEPPMTRYWRAYGVCMQGRGYAVQ